MKFKRNKVFLRRYDSWTRDDLTRYLDERAFFEACEYMNAQITGLEGMTDERRLEIAKQLDSWGYMSANSHPCLERLAFVLRLLGLDEGAHYIAYLTHNAISHNNLRGRFEDIIYKDYVSKVNSEKASKPRNKYYSEVMEVVRLTWEKYPAASPTGMQEKLAVHYHGKVSRGALGNWVNSHDCRPPKPEKYQRFDLVFPQ